MSDKQFSVLMVLGTVLFIALVLGGITMIGSALRMWGLA